MTQNKESKKRRAEPAQGKITAQEAKKFRSRGVKGARTQAMDDPDAGGSAAARLCNAIGNGADWTVGDMEDEDVSPEDLKRACKEKVREKRREVPVSLKFDGEGSKKAKGELWALRNFWFGAYWQSESGRREYVTHAARKPEDVPGSWWEKAMQLALAFKEGKSAEQMRGTGIGCPD
ncbi:unnamed protein product [Parajaminaea phylloscopi]